MDIQKGVHGKFLLKAILFLVPVALVVGLPIFILWRAGEFMSPDEIIAGYDSPATQAQIVGLAYSNPAYYIARKQVSAKKPDVLVLGSSRLDQIHSAFFKNGAGVYVATPLIHKMKHFAQFLDGIPAGSGPRVIIAGLDQNFFNQGQNDDPSLPDDIRPFMTDNISPLSVLADWAKIYRDYFEHKFSVVGVLRRSDLLIGFRAITLGSGMRSDGSWTPESRAYIERSPAEEDANELAAIDAGTDHFRWGSDVSAGSLAALDDFLRAASARHVYVIGIIPPWAPLVYKKIKTLPQKYAYLDKIAPAAEQIFAKYGFEYYDFSDPQKLGFAAGDTYDGIHGTERGSAKLLAALAVKSPVLRQYADPAFLLKGLASAKGDFYLFK